MGTPVVVSQFTDANPFSIDKLNSTIAALVGAINSLAGDTLLQYSATPGLDGMGYMPVTGGAFLGQIAAPSVKVGPSAGPTHDVVTKNDTSTVSAAGIAKAAANIAQLSQTITNPPTQAEVQAITDALDNLLAAMVTAGLMVAS